MPLSEARVKEYRNSWYNHCATIYSGQPIRNYVLGVESIITLIQEYMPHSSNKDDLTFHPRKEVERRDFIRRKDIIIERIRAGFYTDLS